MNAYRFPADTTGLGETPAAETGPAVGNPLAGIPGMARDDAAQSDSALQVTSQDGLVDDVLDIPEVPFSVRVASMWGSTTPSRAAPWSPGSGPAMSDPALAPERGDDGGGPPVDGSAFETVTEHDATSSGDHADPSGPLILDEAQAWQRLLWLIQRHPGRILLGVAGQPGAGKTTYADYLAACTVDAAVVGLDGFQFSSGALIRTGRGARRGAPDTFDLEGYLALLRRLRREDQHTVWAPEYRRDLEEPVGAAVPVRATTRVVVTEGNYLLLPQRQWLEARALCHEVWYVEVPDRVRVERLVGRHRHFGRSKAQARARVTVGVDAENAHIVAATRDRADVVVRLSLSEGEYY